MNTQNNLSLRNVSLAKSVMTHNLLIAATALIWWPSPVFAAAGDVYTGRDGIRSVDKGPPSGGNSGGSSGGSSLAPGTTSIWDSWGKMRKAKQDAKHQQSFDANEEGLQFYKNGEWVKAIAAYERSLKIEPGDAIVLQNLAYAREALANAETGQRNQQAELRNQQQAKASAERMHQSIQNLAQSLTAAPSTSGGLDFDGGKTATAAPGGGSGGGLDFTAAIATPPSRLEFGDPMVVDARKVPSGLPDDLRDAVADNKSGQKVVNLGVPSANAGLKPKNTAPTVNNKTAIEQLAATAQEGAPGGIQPNIDTAGHTKGVVNTAAIATPTGKEIPSPSRQAALASDFYKKLEVEKVDLWKQQTEKNAKLAEVQKKYEAGDKSVAMQIVELKTSLNQTDQAIVGIISKQEVFVKEFVQLHPDPELLGKPTTPGTSPATTPGASPTPAPK